MEIKKASVHPLVLLFAVDHYNREAKGSLTKRVCGILLGTMNSGILDISNCFAVPFEENLENGTWFLDSQYIIVMKAMQRKVSAKEVIVGWYSAFPGAKIRPSDLSIQRMVTQFCPNPLYLVIDVEPKGEFPASAYLSNVDPKYDGTELTLTFRHVPSEMGAQEAEEIGVEHLLRDVMDTNMTSLSSKISQRATSFATFTKHISVIQQYLRDVLEHKLPMNQQIFALLQEIFNLIPDVNSPEIQRALIEHSNDSSLVLLMSNLMRTTLSMHSLIQNKIELQTKKEKEAEEEEEKKEKEREKKMIEGKGKAEREQKEKEEKEKKEKDEDKMDVEQPKESNEQKKEN
ncbi:putative 26S proteasome nonATPase regulatory subunit 7 [Monocercomonoides exilis]|uniref:putative 26S proteasome nonATPase regulatory subunit 7 n=1 Tax=Monocercomonoides exilis TaxID=2049356 RepID=UPI00355A3CB4|nr:putative 26S proteasome nonATPase regulatory subunit 7 [Monocercomonoides exilis]|eukprot:MONOS_13001.1-p1 / transcript=MONOS_13001.1 / gene=MONOS_13001 / organism=Monocercomonoides_exilis_PA203 / gene_product=26S proteasome nonATPase regulatory subunit 7, putative / transcript_product=26S proteasome nonATPase regulatory subunit 7, putative / location=Mono_scaffold00765:12174-13562(+) / protein_length=344 / sequence_SO=supercontig / SO=protein_coding / is_pseudo=false